MPELMERPQDEIEPQIAGAQRCHADEFCFFAGQNFSGHMIYGNDNGDFCGLQDMAYIANDGSVQSFHNQMRSFVNNTAYTIRVYKQPDGRAFTFVMDPFSSNVALAPQDDQGTESYCVDGGRNCGPCPPDKPAIIDPG